MDISAPEPLYRFLPIMQSRRLCRPAADVDAGMMQPTGQATLAPHFSPVPTYFAPTEPASMGMPIGHLTPGPEPRTEQPARIGTLPPSLPSGARWTTPCLPGLESPLS